jgi:hypothetical protein
MASLCGMCAIPSPIRAKLGVIDAYLRQDTFLPVEMTMHVTTVDTSEDDTILYTAFNTGLSISLPPTDQVKSL